MFYLLINTTPRLCNLQMDEYRCIQFEWNNGFENPRQFIFLLNAVIAC